MASYLLTGKDLKNLAFSDSPSEFIGKLLRTPYRKSVEAAILRSSDLLSLANALKLNLQNTFIKIRSFFKEEEEPLYNLVMQRYDVENVKTILRGVANRTPPPDIEAALFPVAKLKDSVLKRLSQAATPREVVDHLASLGLEIAAPLTAARMPKTGGETFLLELALEKWYFYRGFSEASNYPGSKDILHDMFTIEADMTNLMTVFRLVVSHQEKKSILALDQVPDTKYLLVGPGKISFDTLRRSLEESSVASTISHFSDSPYYGALTEGLEKYQKSKLLSDLEKPMRLYQYRRRLHWYTRDPLGIGVLLGYVTMKINEICNLRWILHGIHFGLNAEDIYAELEILR